MQETKKAPSKGKSFLIKLAVALCGSALTCVILLKTPLWGTGLLVTLITALAGFELAVPTGLIKSRYLTVLTVLQAAAVPWAFYFQIKAEGIALWFFCALLLCYAPAIFTDHGPALSEILTSLFAAFIFPAVISLLIALRRMEQGAVYVLIPMIIAWCSDGFALITGMLCGKHKLIERVSPNKTVEGFFGGIAGAVAGMMVYGLILHLTGHTVPWLLFAALGAVGALFGVFGDLALSYTKRCCGIKDFGKLLPGHGGVLDRFDSVLFVLPFCYFVFLFI